MRLTDRYVLVILALVALVVSACGSITGSDDIAQLETRNAQLQGTIDAVGTPMLTVAALENAATQNAVLQSQLNQALAEKLAVQATLTVYELSGGGPAARPTAAAVAVTPGAAQPGAPPTVAVGPTSSPTPPGSDTRFTQTVTATGLDQSDCATGVTSVFDATEDLIYVNTRINVLEAGSTLSARWYANSELFFDDTQCWIPDQDWFNICAYCSIVPDTETFEPGSWTVELLLNGQVLSQAQFQVQGSDAAGDSMTQ